MSKTMKDGKFLCQNRAAICDRRFGESKLERKIKICLLLRSDLKKISVEWSRIGDREREKKKMSICEKGEDEKHPTIPIVLDSWNRRMVH